MSDATEEETGDGERTGDCERTGDGERTANRRSADGVAEIVSETADALAELDPDAPAAIDRDDRLGRLADEAASIVESRSASELLAAVGLDEPEEETDIPATIARGPDRAVVELRTVLELSKLDDRLAEDDGGAAILQELRSLHEPDDDRDAGDAETASEDASDAETASEDGGDETTSEDAGDAETASDDGEASTADEADLDVALRSTVDELLSDVTRDLDVVRDGLEALRDEAIDDEEPGADGDGGAEEPDGVDGDGDEKSDGEDGDGDEKSAGEDGDGDEKSDGEDRDGDEKSDGEDGDGVVDVGDDDGLVDADLGGGDSRSRLSTMPPSERADMRAVTRHSTMPDRN